MALPVLSKTDIYECLDLTNNDLIVVPQFSNSHRLKTLLLGRNQVSLLEENFASQLFQLETISLIDNFIRLPRQIDNLRSCRSLRNLFLVGNPITELPHYRLWCISRIPGLKILDFQKIKDKERKEAAEVFGSVEKPTKLVAKYLKMTSNAKDHKETIDTKDLLVRTKVRQMSASQIRDLKKQLASATKLSEIKRIQAELNGVN